MKKSMIFRIVIAVVIGITVGMVLLFSTMVLLYSCSQESDSLIAESVSPEGTYRLRAYRTNPGATVDYSVKVYLIKNSKEKLIYNVYHEREASIVWKDEHTVLINGISLDLEQGETYKQ